MPTVTTRKKRPNDLDNEIIDVTNYEFERHANKREFFYINRKEHVTYGYFKNNLREEILKGNSIMLVFHSRGGIRLKQYIPNIPTIFMTASIDVIIERCKSRDNTYKGNYDEIRSALLRNKQAYKFFSNKENKLLLLENNTNEPPIAKEVMQKALIFWR